jgi:hypothetical protein
MDMSRRCLIPVLALAILVFVQPADAQETREAAAVTVTGTVVSDASGRPVDGVVVVLEALGLTRVTDAEGRFVLDGVARGVYQIRLIHQDYQSLEGDLTIDRPGEFVLGLTPIEDQGNGMMTGVVGIVTDQVSGQPIPGVVVNVVGLGRVATTDDNGRFTLPELTPRRHDVVFSHLGYRERSESITVEQDRVVRLQIALTVDAIALDPIEVTVDRLDRNLQSVGFYQREEDGWGDFLDREDLEFWNPVQLTSALTRFPGVTTVPDPRMPSRGFLAFRRHGTNCIPTVYLDGIRIGGGRDPAGIDDIVNPSVVAGVEVYRNTAGMPPQYWGTGSSCGVVLIWLRRGG